MKIIVTGSLGNISKPLTEILVAQGHAVTVVSSDPNKQGAIESLGATPAIGSISMHSGKALENFHHNQPKMGKVKLADFAKEFAEVYYKK
jgi:nucleoside-diphosphate-sugar epimerase